MRRIAALICAGFFVAGTASLRADERASEQYLLDIPTVSAALKDAARLNEESHYAGTPGDEHIAQWMRDELVKDGFETTLEAFQSDVPLLKSAQLSIMTKPQIDFDLKEQPIAQDPDGTRSGTGIPFNAFSGNGTVYASVVDAGSGLPEDYRSLAQRGIDVRTRIVLVRYGREFRGLLARRAQQHGASGVIFFSDPAGRDGSERGPAYPNGPYRPLGAVQRGSLSTPRISIPTLPVTAIVAQRLMGVMRNGISDVPVRLHVAETIKPTTLWNTVGILTGADPTHMVVLGAHRDAWVYGVTDNGAGVTTLLEAARALGYLYRSGWRPQFSIVIAGFDGEEVGEVGSQAYVRMHGGELRNGCIAYINEDEDATGQTFAATAAAPLEHVIAPVTQLVRDPREERRTIYQRWRTQRDGVHVAGPGGGSDFEAFLYDLGVPIMEAGFDGVFGVYHSGFDDLKYATTQADPGFVNHRALAQIVALTAMRLSSGTVPYRLQAYVPHMRSALASLSNGHDRDLDPVSQAVNRFAFRAAAADRNGIDGNREIAISRRLDLLFYGRNGYAALAFPDISAAIAGGGNAAISAAVGHTVHELDDISAEIANAHR